MLIIKMYRTSATIVPGFNFINSKNGTVIRTIVLIIVAMIVALLRKLNRIILTPYFYGLLSTTPCPLVFPFFKFFNCIFGQKWHFDIVKNIVSLNFMLIEKYAVAVTVAAHIATSNNLPPVESLLP